MKNTTSILVMALALGASVWNGNAQNQEGNRERRGRAGQQGEARPGGPGGLGGRGGAGGSPLIRALDADQSGAISAAELNNAPAALKALDKDADGKLTAEELRGPRGERPEGRPGQGQNRPERAERPERPNRDREGREGQGRGPGGERGDGPRRQPPLIAALDADHNGTLEAAEIANATAALRTLDKNNDGELTREEIRPGRGEGDADRPRRRGNE